MAGPTTRGGPYAPNARAVGPRPTGNPTATWPCWGSSGVRAWIPRGIHNHPSPLQHPGWNFTPARCTYARSVLLGTALTVSEVTVRATHPARRARTTRVPLPTPPGCGPHMSGGMLETCCPSCPMRGEKRCVYGVPKITLRASSTSTGGWYELQVMSPFLRTVCAVNTATYFICQEATCSTHMRSCVVRGVASSDDNRA